MAHKTFFKCGCMEQGDQFFACSLHRGDAHPTPPPAALAPELHQQIMNLRCDYVGKQPSPHRAGYREGFKDARHAAAELVAAAMSAPPPARAEAPEGADEERWRLAGERVGVGYGCDTPDWMAETILGLRAEVSRLTQALEQAHHQRDEFKRVGQGFERDMRKHFEQSCKNLQRAERAEQAAAKHIKDSFELLDEFTALKAERDQQAGALKEAQRWKDAVQDALVVDWCLNEETANDPQKALAALIEWNIKIHDDPAVSQVAAEREERFKAQAGALGRLQEAATALYIAGRWESATVTAEDAVRLWTELRDAAGLEPGTATRSGVAALAASAPEGEQPSRKS